MKEERETGRVILLHDAGGDRSQTVAALPRILEFLKARGVPSSSGGKTAGPQARGHNASANGGFSDYLGRDYERRPSFRSLGRGVILGLHDRRVRVDAGAQRRDSHSGAQAEASLLGREFYAFS